MFVGKKGGFKFKEWIVLDSVQLPGAASADEEKALGVHCDMEKDELVSHGGPVRYSHKFNAIRSIANPSLLLDPSESKDVVSGGSEEICE